MTDTGRAGSVEDVEEVLAGLPERDGFTEGQAAEFRRRRARIHQRYSEWRRGMPALDELFDSDEHRAKALAGSLATELDRVVELYAAMVGAGAVGRTRAFADPFLVDWVRASRRLAECQGWGEAALDVFDGVLHDLTEQTVRRAAVMEPPRSGRNAVAISPLRRWAIMSVRLLRRFFRPPPARR